MTVLDCTGQFVILRSLLDPRIADDFARSINLGQIRNGVLPLIRIKRICIFRSQRHGLDRRSISSQRDRQAFGTLSVLIVVIIPNLLNSNGRYLRCIAHFIYGLSVDQAVGNLDRSGRFIQNIAGGRFGFGQGIGVTGRNFCTGRKGNNSVGAGNTGNIIPCSTGAAAAASRIMLQPELCARQSLICYRVNFFDLRRIALHGGHVEIRRQTRLDNRSVAIQFSPSKFCYTVGSIERSRFEGSIQGIQTDAILGGIRSVSGIRQTPRNFLVGYRIRARVGARTIAYIINHRAHGIYHTLGVRISRDLLINGIKMRRQAAG